MKNKSLGVRILEGLEEAAAIERGEASPARTKTVHLTARDAVAAPAPTYDSDHVAGVRGKLGLSQPVFAQALNVSPETVRAWEQGKRTPDGAALRLLQVAEKHPQAILSMVESRAPVRKRQR